MGRAIWKRHRAYRKESRGEDLKTKSKFFRQPYSFQARQD